MCLLHLIWYHFISLGLIQFHFILSLCEFSIVVVSIFHQWLLEIVLCRTMTCFERDLHTLISIGDHPCACYLHYFYVPWLIMTSKWVMTLIGMPHCGTTMLLGTSIMMSQWIMSLLCVHNMASQWIMTLLWTYFVIVILLRQIMNCCFSSKLFKIIHINH